MAAELRTDRRCEHSSKKEAGQTDSSGQVDTREKARLIASMVMQRMNARDATANNKPVPTMFMSLAVLLLVGGLNLRELRRVAGDGGINRIAVECETWIKSDYYFLKYKKTEQAKQIQLSLFTHQIK